MVNIPPLSEHRILLVEDDDQTREMSRLHLQYAGFTVIEAPDASTAIRQAKAYLPDLVLCDVFLPDQTGYDVLRALREDVQTLFTPFIFVTGNPDNGLRRQGMELGADDFLHKPYERADLLVAVHTQLMKRAKFHQTHMEQTAALNRTKRQLSLMVAHELRTPLIAVVMAKDLMYMQLGELSLEEMGELLQSMDRGTRRMRHMVEQMVLLTQLETHLLTPYFVQSSGVALQFRLILTAAINLSYEFDTQNLPVDMRSRPPESDEDTVLCDPGSLKHAFAELLFNAVLYGNPKNRQVTISQWTADGFVQISILDNGRGMTTEQIQDALEIFRQIDREVYEQQGMGVGLALADRIIEAHGGTLEIFSVPNKGTQALVKLPLAANNSQTSRYT